MIPTGNSESEIDRRRRGIGDQLPAVAGQRASAHARRGLENVSPTERDAAIAWLYEPTASMKEVGRLFGRSPAWVARAVRSYEIATEPRGRSA